MAYGSPFYIFSLVFLIGITGLLWAVLRKCGEKTQRRVIFLLTLANTLQHFFKSLIYPQYAGLGFTALNSAYNMCAVLIILSPFVFLWGNRFWKNFIFMGFTAGIAAIAVPFWYIGREVSELGWDYARFYICHAILFAASLLSVLLRLHRPSYKEFWQPGLGFLLALSVILVNNVIFITLGLHPEAQGSDLYSALIHTNPCMMMGPTENLLWLVDIIKYFTPSVFLGNNPTGQFAPILWYALPIYLGQSAVTFVVFVLADWKNFRADLKKRRKT